MSELKVYSNNWKSTGLKDRPPQERAAGSFARG